MNRKKIPQKFITHICEDIIGSTYVHHTWLQGKKHLAGLFILCQYVFCIFAENLSCRSETYLTSLTVKKSDSKILLKFSDALADGRLTDIKCYSSLRKAAFS